MSTWQRSVRTLAGSAFGAVLLLGTAPAAQAQVITGLVRDSATAEPLPGVVVVVQDKKGKVLRQGRTGADGRFFMDSLRAKEIRFVVRKVGTQPSATPVYEVGKSVDTIMVDLAVPVAGVTIATLRAVARPPAANGNVEALAFARDNNWQIVEPWRVAAARTGAMSFEDLLRRVPLGGIRVPEQIGDCFSSKRGRRVPADRVAQRRNLCLSFVVDGILSGPWLQLNPMDVHFIAFVPPMKSRLLYGRETEFGAIYVATRKFGDNEERPDRDSARTP